MSESTLERRYRRLLAWYPAAFRQQREEEMLAVLLAAARPGQRRPRPSESFDLIRGAIGTRVRLLGSRPPGQRWADGLALFSITAPVLLLAATVLEIAVPYRLPYRTRFFVLPRAFGPHPQIGGLHLLSFLPFIIALACQAVIVVLVLAGQRWLALGAIAATAGCWIANIYLVPELLQVLSASVFLLAGAALIGSPGPRRGRHLLTWRHGIVLVACVAGVQVSTLMYDAASPFIRFVTQAAPGSGVYFAASVALAAVSALLAASFRLNRYFVLFLAVMFYPYVLQLLPRHGSDDNLIGLPTPQHLTVLFLPALLLSLAAIIAALLPRRPPLLPSLQSGQPPSA